MTTQAAVPVERPVRQVTLVDASWSEPNRSTRGAFQLTLRDEAGEYVLQAVPEDADALQEFLALSRQVLSDVGYWVAGLGSWVPPGRPGASAGWAEASLMRT